MNNYKINTIGVFRSPILSCGKLMDIINQLDSEQAKFLLEDDLIMTAIKIANDDFSEILSDPKALNEQKIKNTFAKYLIRMSTNSTPFGLFSGCSIVTLNNGWNLSSSKQEYLKVHARLNFNLFFQIYTDLVSQNSIREKSSYFLNPTIHRFDFNNSLRFFKFKNDDSSRFFNSSLIQLDYDEVIAHLMEISGKSTYDELCKNSIFKGEEMTDITSYINSLIDLGFFINDLHPSVSNTDYLQVFIDKLEKNNCGKDILAEVRAINNIIQRINTANIHEMPSLLSNLRNYINVKFNTNPKDLLHCDLSYRFDQLSISQAKFKELPKAISKYLSLYNYRDSTIIKRFTEEFYNRYGDAKISLKLFMDRDLGIDLFYNEATYSATENGLFNGLNLSKAGVINDTITITSIKKELLTSILNREHFNLNCLESSDLDHTDLNIGLSFSYDDIGPNSQFLVSHLFHNNLSSTVGRFNYLNNDMSTFFNKLQESEDQAFENKGYEVVNLSHFPGPVTGNICLAKHKRKKSIVLNSNPENLDIYPLEDLFLQVEGGKIVLKSYETGNKIIPRLSNAHNVVNSNSFQLYSLLALISSQHMPFFKDDHQKILDLYNYFPRIYYKDFIFIPETWKLSCEVANVDQDTTISYFKENQLPTVFNIVDSSRRSVLINLENSTMYAVMKSIIGSSPNFVIQECIYNVLEKKSHCCEIFICYSN